MNCHEAQEQIDERIQAEADGQVAGSDQWSKLDAHLAGCAKCSAAWTELRRTRALLTRAASDAPKSEELETMWNAIAQTSLGTVTVKKKQSTGVASGWQFAAAFVGVAVILGSAFWLGFWRYGHEFRVYALTSAIPHVATFSRLRESDGRLATESNIKSIGTSSKVVSGDIERKTRSSYAQRERKARHKSQKVKKKKTIDPARSRGIPSGSVFGGGSPDDSAAMLPGEERARTDGVAGELKSEDTPKTWRLQELVSPATDYRNRATIVVDENAPQVLGPWSGGVSGEVLGVDGHAQWKRNSSFSADALSSSISLPPAPQTTPPPAASAQAKIIKTGALTIEVEVYADAFKQLEDTVRQYQAFVADVSTREQAGGAIKAILKIRVAPESFETLFAVLKTVGRIEFEDIRANDVTDEYVDLESRISGLEAMEQRLSDLIANKSFVDKISSLLEVEREFKRVRVEREQLLGRIRVIQDRITMSTITLTLHEPPRTVPEATLSIETTTLDEAAGALGELLARLNGRLLSGTTAKQPNGTLSGVYRLQIRLTHFRELLDAIEGLGRISRRAVNDQQFGNVHAPWAENVHCVINLNIAERAQELPSGAMQLEVDTLSKALQQVDAALSPLNGSIVSNQTTRMDDGSQHAELDLLVPAGVFGDLVDSITGIGRTMEKSLSGNIGRIVGGAAATPCRLSLTLAERTREVPSGHIIVVVKEFESARTQLAKLVTDKNIHVSNSTSNQRTDGSWAGSFNLGIPAKDMETVVARLESLGRVASRHIQGLGLGDLSRVLPDTIGVIDLSLAEPKAISPGPDQAGQSIRNRLRDGFVVMYASFGLIAYGLVVMVPWVLIVLLPAWLVFRVTRRRKSETVDNLSS